MKRLAQVVLRMPWYGVVGPAKYIIIIFLAPKIIQQPRHRKTATSTLRPTYPRYPRPMWLLPRQITCPVSKISASPRLYFIRPQPHLLPLLFTSSSSLGSILPFCHMIITMIRMSLVSPLPTLILIRLASRSDVATLKNIYNAQVTPYFLTLPSINQISI